MLRGRGKKDNVGFYKLFWVVFVNKRGKYCTRQISCFRLSKNILLCAVGECLCFPPPLFLRPFSHAPSSSSPSSPSKAPPPPFSLPNNEDPKNLLSFKKNHRVDRSTLSKPPSFTSPTFPHSFREEGGGT